MRGEIDYKSLVAALTKVPKALNVEAQKAFKLHGALMIDRMQKRFTGYTGRQGTEGGLLQNRSKLLKNSFMFQVAGGLGQGSSLTLLVYSSGVKYARMQEYGGTVRPKRAKYLTIPLPDAMTSSGVQRYPGGARALFLKYPDRMSVVKSPKSGNLFIVSDGKPGVKDPKGKNADLQWLYILKKSVVIPPRLGFRSTWASQEMVNDRAARLNLAAKTAIARAGLGGGA